MSRYSNLDSHIEEAQRQLTTCNACRYCEGFCSVFPAVHRLTHFSENDTIQLSNLCHNCRACHYACQFTEPHEYNINIPQALADVRVESYAKFNKPQVFSKLFQFHGVSIVALLLLSLTAIMLVSTGRPADGGANFYSYMSHNIMVLIFAPVFVLPLFAIALGVRSYWKTVGGKSVSLTHIKLTIANIAGMKNLSGGQGQGCNFENEDRYSNARRYYHQFAAYGFLLCFLSTSTATVLHYLFNMPAPYAWYSLPKLFGISGGIGLVIGCGGLALLKLRADSNLGAQRVWGAEMAFILLLGFTGLSGLVLYLLTGHAAVKYALAVHLSAVLSLFLLMPYSKMVHGFYRLAAILREMQNKD